MSGKIIQIKDLVKGECESLGFSKDWFYEVHLLGVEGFAKKLLEKLPEADEEIVLLGVWLHDMQRIRGIKGDHAKAGAQEAEKVMRQFGYEAEVIEKVKEAILSHRCDVDPTPATVEARILASADAMSHYINDFYLHIATLGTRSVPEFKKWALEKMDRDYNKKISFDFAREMIEERHKALKSVLTTN